MPLTTISPESASSSGDARQLVNPWVLVVSVVLTGISAAVYAAIYFSGQGFLDLFRGFGADLPFLTRVVLDSFKYYGVLIFIGLAPCIALLWDRERSVTDSNRLFTLVLVSFCLSFVVLGLCVAAAYLPIFKMGAVVQ